MTWEVPVSRSACFLLLVNLVSCAHSPTAPTAPVAVTPERTAQTQTAGVPAPKQKARGAQAQGLITSCRVGAIVQKRDGTAPTDFVPGNLLDDLPDNTEVTVKGSYAGWIEVKEAWNAAEEDRTWPEGWVHGSQLTTELKTLLQGKPNAPLLYEFPNRDGDAFPIDVQDYDLRLVGCHDLFLAVRITYPDTRPNLHGWLFVDDHCPSTVTTCP